MEFVRKIVDASSLMKIMQLPDTLMNRKLEIIVLPVEDNQKGAFVYFVSSEPLARPN